MRLHQAIDQAGEGGKIKRNAYTNCATVPRMDSNKDLTHGIGGEEYSLGVSDLTATDWEVVKDEVIEVGDEVDTTGSIIKRGVVEYIRHGTAMCYVSLPGYYGDCPQVLSARNLTLIRKGPKVHTFEGVRLIKIKEADEIGSSYVVPKKHNLGFIPFKMAKDGKTYTMTLTEEVTNDADSKQG